MCAFKHYQKHTELVSNLLLLVPMDIHYKFVLMAVSFKIDPKSCVSVENTKIGTKTKQAS